MANKLYVGNLNFRVTAEQLKTLFSSYGEVSNVELVSDRYTGRSRGFAFVEMASEEAAGKAREALNGKPFEDRNLTIDWARPEGSSGGGGRHDRREGSGPRKTFRRY